MRRRRFLQLLVGVGVLAGGSLIGWAAPVVAGVRSAAGRTLRAPADLMACIRRRTRPLTPDELDKPHDLAG